jgi:hypothetical protein
MNSQPPSWSPEYRRKKYREDSAYRHRVLKARRRLYHKQKGKVRRESCLVNLPSIKNFGTVRMAYVGDSFKPSRRLTFTLKELAAVLGRRPEVVMKWVREELFPQPLIEVEGMRENVYTLNEARALVEVMGEHQEETSYYRADHVETRQRLFEELEKACE